MQTCSNCGASNREGAKFCTTCGTRLNPVTATSGSTGWGALDDDATRVETPAVTTDEPTTTAEPTTTEASAWSAQEPVATAWSWNQTRTSEELAVPVSSDEPATTTPSSSPSSWASQWTSAETDDFGDDDEPAVTTTTGAPVWESPEPAIADATTTTAAPAWTTTTTSAAPEPDVIDNTTPVDDVIPVAAVADVPDTDDTAPVTIDAPATLGTRARAQELIAELQSLLDSGFAEPPADADNDAASALTALATLGDDDDSRFDALRETVGKLRSEGSNFRNSVDLVDKVEVIGELLDAYEAQRTAIAEARATLQG